MIFEIIFFFVLFLFFQTFILYPISIYILSALFKKKYSSSENQPSISIIISAFNEEKVVENTVQNFLNLDYDSDKIEIIIGSDNSTDRTNEIIKTLAEDYKNIRSFIFEKRRGKGHVLNDLVREAKNEILVFSDANTIYRSDALKNLVKHYDDQRVGGISGKLILNEIDDSNKSGVQEHNYWKIETYLKELEGSLGVLVGANGGIYSIRRELYSPIPTEYSVMDDFYVSLKVVEQKYDMLYVNNALADEDVAPTIKSEFRRKVRNNSIDLSSLKSIKKLLMPSRGLIAYALWSHKVIRWFSPLLLILLFSTNLLIINQGDFFLYFFILQCVIYILCLLGILLHKLGIHVTVLQMGYYFLMTNVAMLLGLLKFLSGNHTAYWKSTAR